MPFSRYRIVELGTGISLAYAGKLFAGFGAEVVKIEAPGGDPGRREKPLVELGGGPSRKRLFRLGEHRANRPGLPTMPRRKILIAGADVLLDARGPDEGGDWPSGT